MSEIKLNNPFVVAIIAAVVSILGAGYTTLLTTELNRLNTSLTKTETRINTEISRIRQDVEAVAKEQKLTIERLHVEYCGIQKSLADINVSVTALNSRLISRDDVEKISRREATLYHQAAEASKREVKK